MIYFYGLAPYLLYIECAVSLVKKVNQGGNTMNIGGKWPRLLLLFLLISAVVLVRVTGISHYLNEDTLKGLISQYKTMAPLVYIGIYSVAPALFLPGLPLTVAAGILFGPFWGVVYAITGATIGASIAFLIARYIGRDWVEQRITGERLKRLDQEVARHGWKVVAFTRLIPLFPFNMLNYAFGLTRIGFFTYALVSFFCMLPAAIAYVVFSASLLDVLRGNISWKFIVGLLLLAVVTAIPLIYKKKTLHPGLDEGPSGEDGE